MSTVDQKRCIEEPLRYTLTSFINGTLKSDLGLSKSYCSDLLLEDFGAAPASFSGDLVGVPSYPFDKRLAAALYESVTSGVLYSGGKEGLLFQVDDEVKQNEKEWSMLVSESGSAFINVCKSIGDFTLKWRKAIQVRKPADQPFDFLATILSGLNYAGIQHLLGLTHMVTGSFLSQGARALGKHANRDGCNYWGSSNGNDSDKNRQSLEVVSKMLGRCCHLNIHISPPHGEVFEIWVADGYGARWTNNATRPVSCPFWPSSLGSSSHTWRIVTQKVCSLVCIEAKDASKICFV